MLNFLDVCGFYKIENGREFYRYGNKENGFGICAYTIGNDFVTDYDGRNLRLVPIAYVLKEWFIAARQQFAELLRSILDGSDDFHFAKGCHYLVAYRKEEKKNCGKETNVIDNIDRHNLYRFVVFCGTGNVKQYICSVEDLLYQFGLTNSAKVRELIQQNDFPLYNSARENDRYLYLSLKFLAGLATQQEADEATAVDGHVRFVPENKIYNDVEILQVKQCPIWFVYRKERYDCTIAVFGRVWHAEWCPDETVLHVRQEFSKRVPSAIQLSEKVLTELRNKAVKIYPYAIG